MENFILLPQPSEVVFIAFVIAYLLCWQLDFFLKMEDKLHLRKVRILPVLFLLLFPLVFARWDEDVLVIVRQCLGYALVVLVAMLFGMLSYGDEKRPLK